MRTSDTNRLLVSAGVPVGSPEALLPNGKKSQVETIVEGKPVTWFHVHTWEKVPWDIAKLGPSVTDLPEQITKHSGYYATYHSHWRCGCCKKEIIETTRALL